mmetsp:Transcript_77279/g.202770  ORF Transcript_77279/g.202770 Transcript_77279/m.202770 type:complete len:268 (-) Transcript_77279:347-1150(-)
MAKPVEMSAPATPSTCEAAHAALPIWSATRVPATATPSTTAPAVSEVSKAPPTVIGAALSFVAVLALLLQVLSRSSQSDGGRRPPEEPSSIACRACSHSLRSSATTKASRASRESCLLRSERCARSARESPAKAMPPVMAEPTPSPTPTGGAAKRSTAEAMPSPALAVLVTLTPTHWPVKRASSSRSPLKVRRWMSSKACMPAQARFVVQVSWTFGLPATITGAAPSAASSVLHLSSAAGRVSRSSQRSHSSGRRPGERAAFQARPR